MTAHEGFEPPTTGFDPGRGLVPIHALCHDCGCSTLAGQRDGTGWRAECVRCRTIHYGHQESVDVVDFKEKS